MAVSTTNQDGVQKGAQSSLRVMDDVGSSPFGQTRYPPNLPFYERLDPFGDRLCLLDPGGRGLSYRDVARQADRSVASLSGYRRLVLLESSNTIEAILAYLGCLRAGHVVALLPQGGATHAVNAGFRFNAVIRSSQDGLTVDPLDDSPHELHPELRVLLSTSGTTGTPRWVKLSRTNVDANARSIVSYLNLSPNDRGVTSLRFHYAYGMSVLHSHLSAGASVLVMDTPVCDPGFTEACRRYRVTNMAGVPQTFRQLAERGEGFRTLPDLRIATQAGGKLESRLVRRFAHEAAEAGRRFFVMYGQTEASPRMAFLRPELAKQFPDCIGEPIPGGELQIVDDSGHPVEEPDREGEIVYRGPNVMMGYAVKPADLATDENLECLPTGDLGVRTPEGLIRITGRRARFVKPGGVRISLDALEEGLRNDGISAAVVGNDAAIGVFLPGDSDVRDLRLRLARMARLPASQFQIRPIDRLPQTDSGKTDYPELERLFQLPVIERPRSRWQRAKAFLARALEELSAILFGRTTSWSGVSEIFSAHFPDLPLSDGDSFASLGGDSILYVQIEICLEELWGFVPHEWHLKTLGELEWAHDG